MGMIVLSLIQMVPRNVSISAPTNLGFLLNFVTMETQNLIRQLDVFQIVLARLMATPVKMGPCQHLTPVMLSAETVRCLLLLKIVMTGQMMIRDVTQDAQQVQTHFGFVIVWGAFHKQPIVTQNVMTGLKLELKIVIQAFFPGRMAGDATELALVTLLAGAVTPQLLQFV